MMVFISIYGIVDGFFVSNYVGKVPFAAINYIYPFIMILGSLGFMFGTGGSALIAKTLGEGDREKAYNQGYAFLGMGVVFGLLAAGIVMLISEPMIRAYSLSEETQVIARQLMLSISIIIVFQATNSIMTKGVLRGGGDTKMLMVADNVFLWVASLPLGIIAGLVLHLPAFWIYFFLKLDQVLKAIWCVIRLRSGKWIKKIKTSAELETA
jgi:Na+-driven multidrug efflux pump